MGDITRLQMRHYEAPGATLRGSRCGITRLQIRHNKAPDTTYDAGTTYETLQIQHYEAPGTTLRGSRYCRGLSRPVDAPDATLRGSRCDITKLQMRHYEAPAMLPLCLKMLDSNSKTSRVTTFGLGSLPAMLPLCFKMLENC